MGEHGCHEGRAYGSEDRHQSERRLRDDRVMLTVRTAADAEVALDIVRQDAPACVVTDPPIDS
jgi:hypothetical protein